MVVEGFESPSSQVVGLHLLHCGCPLVHAVLLGPCRYCDPILHIVSVHCSFVLT